MRRTQAERDQAQLQRRLEVLKLPVVPLEHHGFVMPSDRAGMQVEPEAVGVGPDGTALAVWSHRKDPTRKQVTWHFGDKEVGGAIDVQTDLRLSFVQPLPEGRVLLAAARAGHGEPNGTVWTIRVIKRPNRTARAAQSNGSTGRLGVPFMLSQVGA
jgi:hypothetical protein